MRLDDILILTLIEVFQSTHPRRVRQLVTTPINVTQYISIHAPAKGATINNGGRRKERYISIHAPAKGATPSACFECFVIFISIHAPAKGATMAGSFKASEEIISIHAPAKGATHCGDGRGKYGITFQSTHPRRVRQRPLHLKKNPLRISIHAPAKGATAFFSHYLLLKNTANHFLKSFISFFPHFL